MINSIGNDGCSSATRSSQIWQMGSRPNFANVKNQLDDEITIETSNPMDATSTQTQRGLPVLALRVERTIQSLRFEFL